jgi:hypothetical protein
MTIFGNAPIKAEGSVITHTTAGIPRGRIMTPLVIQEGDRSIVVAEMLLRLEYILQRAVPNYDELVQQFNAVKDIERSNNEY